MKTRAKQTETRHYLARNEFHALGDLQRHGHVLPCKKAQVSLVSSLEHGAEIAKLHKFEDAEPRPLLDGDTYHAHQVLDEEDE